jgi:Uma2 family endonuclease
MSTRTLNRPTFAPPIRRLHRFTLAQYERLVEIGLLNSKDRAELIDGWLVDKMPQNPRHAGAVDLARKTIEPLLSREWTTRSQFPVRLPGDNAPEPDLVIVPAPSEQYFDRHPTEKDVALVIEVADATLEEDRRWKLPLYARAKIPVFWIVNLVDRVVEVYTEPRGGKSPTYKQQMDYGPAAEVPVIVRGQVVGCIAARKLLPKA